MLAAVKDEPRSRAVACDDPWPPLRAAPCACCRPGRRNGAQPNRDTAVGGVVGLVHAWFFRRRFRHCGEEGLTVHRLLGLDQGR